MKLKGNQEIMLQFDSKLPWLVEGSGKKSNWNSYLHYSFKIRTGLAGRPGLETGPDEGKNPFGSWSGETRFTRSNPGETRSIFFIY